MYDFGYRVGFSLSSVLLGLIVISPVHAQTAPAEYVIKLKPPALELIGRGLGKLPFEEVAPLMQELRQQVMEQQQPSKPQSSSVPDPEKPK